MTAAEPRREPATPLAEPPDLQRRLDEWNREGGYPPATDWRTRTNDAYWLGWFDSQEAMRKSSEGAAAAARRETPRVTADELTAAIMAAVGSPHADDFGIRYRDKKGFSPAGLADAILRRLAAGPVAGEAGE